ncbi:hypothetical protein Desaci_2519 [Desulfosporosinus acidiphilus SJ4]|uniref:Uncharacterized protein n=1 Tax=Desulfosporosinus acidiphilus (strain DSM 22704 / JCM 16185 / SJ4) TaxID=646529 RepID=I4D6N9_DESAJ|nr:hypothetical protein Desaci_2519 [Desulfosporosinus acidiphilus SJ4]
MSFVKLLYPLKSVGKRVYIRKNYFGKLVNCYRKNVYHIERRLKKLSDGKVNPIYSTGQVIRPVLLGFLRFFKAEQLTDILWLQLTEQISSGAIKKVIHNA